MPHVTRAEARVPAEAVHRPAGYLWRLCSRMEHTGRRQDPLHREANRARDALHGLWVSLHYRGCGVTRPPEVERSPGPAEDENKSDPDPHPDERGREHERQQE